MEVEAVSRELTLTFVTAQAGPGGAGRPNQGSLGGPDRA